MVDMPYGSRPGRYVTPGAALKPLGFTKQVELVDIYPRHYRERERVAVGPLELRHVLEIHAVDTGDHGRHGHQRRVGGKPLHDLALLQRDEGQVDQGPRDHHVALVVYRLVDAREVVVDVAEIILGARAD